MLVVKSDKVKAFDLTPFSAFTCVKLNEQSFGLIMTADASPKDLWLTLLIKLNRISETFVACAVEKGCPWYLDHAKRVRPSARLEKTLSEKVTCKIMT